MKPKVAVMKVWTQSKQSVLSLRLDPTLDPVGGESWGLIHATEQKQNKCVLSCVSGFLLQMFYAGLTLFLC